MTAGRSFPATSNWQAESMAMAESLEIRVAEKVESFFERFKKVAGGCSSTAGNLTAAYATMLATERAETHQDPVLTVQEAADRLKVHPNTVYDMCESGRLKHSRFGTGRGTIRIAADDLAQCVKHGTVDRRNPSDSRHYRPPGERYKRKRQKASS